MCKKNNALSTPGFKSVSLDGANSSYFSLLTEDGGYIIGSIDTALKLTIAKYDQQARLISSNEYVSYSERYFTSAYFQNGHLVVSGFDVAKTSYFTTVFDAGNTMLWDKSYAFPLALNTVASCVLEDGNILMAMGSIKDDTTNFGTYFVTLDIATGDRVGTLKAVTGFSKNIKCQPTQVVVAGGNVFLSGYYYSTVAGLIDGSSFLLKMGLDGEADWLTRQPITDVAAGVPIVVPYDLTFTGSGTITQTAVSSFDNHLEEIYFKFNYLSLGTILGEIVNITYDTATGVARPTVLISGAHNAATPMIRSTSDNGYIIIVTGNWAINSSTEHTDFSVIKTDGQFNVLWQKTHNIVGKTMVVSDIKVNVDGYDLLGYVSSVTNDKFRLSGCHIKMGLMGEIVN